MYPTRIKKKGNGYNDGMTKDGMSGCYRGGSIFGGRLEDDENPDVWYRPKQD